MEEEPQHKYERLKSVELFRLTRKETIFLVLAGRLKLRDRPQFYKAEQIAEDIEAELKRRDSLL